MRDLRICVECSRSRQLLVANQEKNYDVSIRRHAIVSIATSHSQICTHIDENHLDLLPEHIKTQTIKLKKTHIITPISLVVDTEHRPTTTMQSVGATDSNKHRSTQLLNEKRNL